MAIIQYTCDTCKRKIELPSNERGLETPLHCIITQGCVGELYQTDRFDNHTKPKKTMEDLLVNDWIYTPKLLKYTQQTPSLVWGITHNLNNHPRVIVYDSNGDTIKKYNIEYIDNNNVRVVFPSEVSGQAHCITASQQKNVNQLSPQTQNQISSSISKNLAIATDNLDAIISLTFQINDPDGVTIDFVVSADNHPPEHSWVGYHDISIAGGAYVVREIKLDYVYGFSSDVHVGSTVSLTHINNIGIQPKEIFYLLPPSDSIINVGVVVDAHNNSITIGSEELLVDTKQITPIYPLITQR